MVVVIEGSMELRDRDKSDRLQTLGLQQGSMKDNSQVSTFCQQMDTIREHWKRNQLCWRESKVHFWNMLNQEASETHESQGQVHRWVNGSRAWRGGCIESLYLEGTYRKQQNGHVWDFPSFAKLQAMVYSHFTKSTPHGMLEYALDLESDNTHLSSGSSND